MVVAPVAFNRFFSIGFAGVLLDGNRIQFWVVQYECMFARCFLNQRLVGASWCSLCMFLLYLGTS